MKAFLRLAALGFSVAILGILFWQRYALGSRAKPVEAPHSVAQPTQLSPAPPAKARLAENVVPPVETALPEAERANPTTGQRDDPFVSEPKGLQAETSALSEKPTSPSAFKNVGSETAMAVVETALWAASNGDLESSAGMNWWRGGGLDYAKASFLRLPPTLQQQAGTPDRLMAMELALDVGAATSIQMTLHSVYGPSAENIRVRFTQADGATSEVQFLMCHTESGWKRELSSWDETMAGQKLVRGN